MSLLRAMTEWRSCCAACLLMLALPASASWDDARAVVEQATGEMMTLLADPALRDEANFEALFAGVDQILTPVVDFEVVSRGVMGKYYRRATPAEQQRFAEVFKGTLIKTYAKALAAFQFERYEVVPNRAPSKKPHQQLVRVDVIDSNGTRYELAYFMVRDDSGWRLTNVVLDGINLRQVFRNQFADALNTRGEIGAVIDAWADLVDQPGKET
ncbi:MlaC/ttg2D family ABC transporter substrate-binding protein [Motiliproteus sediminis]|uniref:MlaC/ttg2D family ABC transporter substrate-binding protein n=1 Tax=Motiliproteus sediminis TaxID=1468178 RepID=UPI001AEF6B16|nr:ABC transporter substrate-binding protein [Motiliproteus sediminis]